MQAGFITNNISYQKRLSFRVLSSRTGVDKVHTIFTKIAFIALTVNICTC
uniref:Uncharacterized protein n=1 Tax=Anguilla anguilla TaxID=7936 RepID=A0A0E9PNH7_ANGAN